MTTDHGSKQLAAGAGDSDLTSSHGGAESRDLEYRPRGGLQRFPWGLSGSTNQMGVPDLLVIIDPALGEVERRRQVSFMRWEPTLLMSIWLALGAGLLALALLTSSLWMMVLCAVPAIVLRAQAPALMLTRVVERIFERRVPRAGRVVLGGSSVGVVNDDANLLHMVLLNLAREQRDGLLEVPASRESEILAEVWDHIRQFGPYEMVSLSRKLDEMACKPVMRVAVEARSSAANCSRSDHSVRSWLKDGEIYSEISCTALPGSACRLGCQFGCEPDSDHEADCVLSDRGECLAAATINESGVAACFASSTRPAPLRDGSVVLVPGPSTWHWEYAAATAPGTRGLVSAR